MKYRFALMLLVLALMLPCGGCKKPNPEEADTTSQVMSRGKYAKAYGLFADASFSESGSLMFEAMKVLKESLVFDPGYSRANACMAYCILELCRSSNIVDEQVMDISISLESAYEYALRATSNNPTSAEAHSILAMVKMRMGDLEGAKKSLKIAADWDKTNREYLIARGDFYVMSNVSADDMARSYAKAVENYYKAIEMESTFGVPYVRILEIYETVDDAAGIESIITEITQHGMKISDTRRLRLRSKGLIK